MYAQVENKSRAVANTGGQRKSNAKQSFEFADRRHESIAQRRMKDVLDKHAELQNTPIQMVRNGKKIPPKLVRKTNFIPWAWTDNLKLTWGNWNVPNSSVHDSVVMNNQLYGGYTVLFGNGAYKQRTNYGPYTPGPGTKKDNHVERKFWREMEGQMEIDIADVTYENEDVLCVVDINQHHTPCSGPSGCTTFLNEKISQLSLWDGATGVGRFKACDRYDTSLSETHPGRAKKTEITEMDSAEAMEVVDKGMIVHSYTDTDRNSY